MLTSYTFTGTAPSVTQAVSVPPTPPPLVVAVCVIAGAPGVTGVKVNVTGVASEISPGLPSLASLIVAQRVIGPAVPPGELTLTEVGFESDGVTMASSFSAVSVLEPLLPVPGVELE